MQTFLPYRSFERSLKVLDSKRLGKQRLEAMQLVRSIENPTGKGWMNHPARLQWIGYLDALKLYFNISVDEWVSRGYNNTMSKYDIPVEIEYPWWLGKRRFHSSHRSRLLAKDYEFYSKYGWKDDPTAGYWWPVTKDNMRSKR